MDGVEAADAVFLPVVDAAFDEVHFGRERDVEGELACPMMSRCVRLSLIEDRTSEPST